ncbi:hypothetical protein EDB82DRAFT_518548 [Fusarium venenatum]|uniref:uncharacterized protein n=1 Tax=Fusarium venenatum TaxID=56646 RepID=UPI001DB32B08|nr:hypothetical protein EDB82DRAFT_518548 [Fusarium venenatum]
MGIRDFLKLRRKKKGDSESSPSPSSAETAVSNSGTSAQEVQQSNNSQNEPSCQNVPDIVYDIELVTTSQPPTKTLTQGLESSIWIEAYTKLKDEDTKLVARYEKVLEKLIQEDSFDENVIEEAPMDIGKPAQIQRMDKAIQLGLRRTEKEAKLKGRFGDMTRLINIVRPVVDKAVKPSPEAALVWSCFTFGLEVLANPVTEFEAQRSGVEYVISRLDWYVQISESVLSEGKTPVGLQNSLFKNLTSLYKLLLSFVLKSICLYHRSRLLVTMRDLFKYDDWESQVKSIKDNEDAVERDLEQYHDTEFRKGLQAISTTATEIWEDLKKWRDEEKDEKCRTVISKTIPFFTKASLLKQKGGLVPECCDWLFTSEKFQKWKNEPESRVMWISGDAGKGKTMLLCAIAEWFQYSRCVAYFFCKETDERLNNEAAILRGIIYSITEKTPALLKHAQDNIDGLRLDGADGTQALCKTLKSILADPLTSDAIILIDALDECTQNDSDEDEAPGGILSFIAGLATSSPVKWLISSRNTLSAVGIQLGSTSGFLHLSLEDSTYSVSRAVAIFVRKKVAALREYTQIDSESQDRIVNQLILGADETFLWVSLVLSDIRKTLRNKKLQDPVGFIQKQTQEMPKSLDALYWAILRKDISDADSEDGIDVKDVLKVVYLAYRPLTIQELQYLLESPNIRLQKDPNDLKILFNQASAFLTIEDTVVSFVHQSAKDFITKYGSDLEVAILPKDKGCAHRALFYRSMANISDLRENIFDIEHPGTNMDELIRSDSDPLAPVGYSCTHWIYHLLFSNSPVDIEIQEKVYTFLSKHLLRWMEALAWMEELPVGEELLDKVKGWVPHRQNYNLQSWINDAYRFYVKFCPVVMETPLQVYASALVFAPLTSLIKQANPSPKWITHISGISEAWDPCAVTIEGLDYGFYKLYWHNNHRLVSYMTGRNDDCLMYWSTKIGLCIRQTLASEIFMSLRNHSVSKSGQVLAAFGNKIVHVLDAATGNLQKYDTEFDIDKLALSSNGKYLLATCQSPPHLNMWDMTRQRGDMDYVSWERHEALGGFNTKVAFITETLFVLAFDKTIVVEDVEGKRWHWLKVDHDIKTLTACSGNSARFITSDDVYILQVWDALSGKCLGKFDLRADGKCQQWQVAPDGSMLALTKDAEPDSSELGSKYSIGKRKSLNFELQNSVVKLFYLPPSPPTVPLKIDCGGNVAELAFSNNNKMLASAISEIDEIIIWDTRSGKRLMVLRGHSDFITWLSFSPDSCRIASSTGGFVKIWDIEATEADNVESFENQMCKVKPSAISFSPDGQSLCTIKSSTAPQTWSNKGPEPFTSRTSKPWDHTWTSSIAFSPDSSKFGLFLQNQSIEVWDARNEDCSLICALQAKKLGLSEISFISFSNKGNLMAVNSSDSLAVWSLDQETCISILDSAKVGISLQRDRITRFLKDDHYLISSTDSGCFIISDVDGKYHRTLDGHDSRIWALEVTSQHVISSTYSEVRIWDMRNPEEISLISSIGTRIGPDLRLLNPRNNSLLYTNLGILRLEQSTQESSQPPGKAMESQFRGYGIKYLEGWVTKDGKEILWLPEEYRPIFLDYDVSIWGSMIAIAGTAGLLVIHFSESWEIQPPIGHQRWDWYHQE